MTPEDRVAFKRQVQKEAVDAAEDRAKRKISFFLKRNKEGGDSARFGGFYVDSCRGCHRETTFKNGSPPICQDCLTKGWAR